MFSIKTHEHYPSAHCLLKNVGVTALNKQHLLLTTYALEFNQLIEELATREPTHADWKHVDGLFSRIMRYVATHFRDEEELMKSLGYPDYEAHKRQHDHFVDEMANIQSQINNRNIKFKASLSTLLWDWLYKHINEVDYHYRDFFLEKGVK